MEAAVSEAHRRCTTILHSRHSARATSFNSRMTPSSLRALGNYRPVKPLDIGPPTNRVRVSLTCGGTLAVPSFVSPPPKLPLAAPLTIRKDFFADLPFPICRPLDSLSFLVLLRLFSRDHSTLECCLLRFRPPPSVFFVSPWVPD